MADHGAPLSDITRRLRTSLGLSLRALAGGCIDPDDPEAGPLWKYGTLANLESGRPSLTPPREAELRALAAALDAPVSMLKEAAAVQFFGIEPHPAAGPTSEAMQILVHRAERLDPVGLQRLLHFAEVLHPGWEPPSDGK